MKLSSAHSHGLRLGFRRTSLRQDLGAVGRPPPSALRRPIVYSQIIQKEARSHSQRRRRDALVPTGRKRSRAPKTCTAWPPQRSRNPTCAALPNSYVAAPRAQEMGGGWAALSPGADDGVRHECASHCGEGLRRPIQSRTVRRRRALSRVTTPPRSARFRPPLRSSPCGSRRPLRFS